MNPEMKRQLETWAYVEVNDIKDPKLTECERGVWVSEWVAGLFKTHCYLKGHLFKMGLTDIPILE
jgi:hypothetical protein